MNKLARTILAATVMASVTVAPASAATLEPAAGRDSAGICRLFPRVCQLNSAELEVAYRVR